MKRFLDLHFCNFASYRRLGGVWVKVFNALGMTYWVRKERYVPCCGSRIVDVEGGND